MNDKFRGARVSGDHHYSYVPRPISQVHIESCLTSSPQQQAKAAPSTAPTTFVTNVTSLDSLAAVIGSGIANSKLYSPGGRSPETIAPIKTAAVDTRKAELARRRERRNSARYNEWFQRTKAAYERATAMLDPTDPAYQDRADAMTNALTAAIKLGPDYQRRRRRTESTAMKPVANTGRSTLRTYVDQLTHIVYRAYHTDRFDARSTGRRSFTRTIPAAVLPVYKELVRLSLKYQGQVYPSIKLLAHRAAVGRSTCVQALNFLREWGWILVHRRAKRIKTPLGQRLVQDTNQYELIEPRDLARIAINHMTPNPPNVTRLNEFTDAIDHGFDLSLTQPLWIDQSHQAFSLRQSAPISIPDCAKTPHPAKGDEEPPPDLDALISKNNVQPYALTSRGRVRLSWFTQKRPLRI